MGNGASVSNRGDIMWVIEGGGLEVFYFILFYYFFYFYKARVGLL